MYSNRATNNFVAVNIIPRQFPSLLLLYMCVCVCACACVRACVCDCVCLCSVCKCVTIQFTHICVSITDDTSHKDKLTLTVTEATWQHTDTLSVVTHSVILHHFDVSMSCDTPTTTPTSKLIRGPVVTRGNKEAFRTNMGTLVLPDCDGNVLEAYCAYPNGKGNGKCVCECVLVHFCVCVCVCTRVCGKV